MPGYRRVLGVAMDNRVDLPGYKYYRRPDGSRPAVYVAFADLVAYTGGPPVNGVCVRVDPEELPALDARERNYDRCDMTHLLADPPGLTWMYLGSIAGHERLAHARESGTAVVARSYLTTVESGFRALGLTELTAFRRSTDFGAVTVEELERFDLPPGEAQRASPAGGSTG